MVGTVPTLRCPDCTRELLQDRTRMNMVVDECPQDHGVFLDRGDLTQLVGEQATLKIHDLLSAGDDAEGACPNCRARFRRVSLIDVETRGCRNCGALWFETMALKEHVLGVRRRAYGEGSMSSRTDVMRDAAAFYPVEVVAGLLTEFELEETTP